MTVISRSFGEQVELSGIGMQQLEIPGHIMDLDRGEPHAPFDPASQRALLVKHEIMGSFREQKIDYLRQSIACVILRIQTTLWASHDQPGAIFRKCVRQFSYRKHLIHGVGQNRVPWHTVIAGFVGILCDNQSAVFPDGFQADTAIGTGARENHADGARFVLRRQ